jgi:hypothetical protein
MLFWNLSVNFTHSEQNSSISRKATHATAEPLFLPALTGINSNNIKNIAQCPDKCELDSVIRLLQNTDPTFLRSTCLTIPSLQPVHSQNVHFSNCQNIECKTGELRSDLDLIIKLI